MLVDRWALDFLPDVLGDVVALDGIYDILLVNSAAESEDVVVLERAESNTRSRNPEAVNLLPLVLLDIIHLTEPVDLAVDKSTHDVDEAFDGA